MRSLIIAVGLLAFAATTTDAKPRKAKTTAVKKHREATKKSDKKRVASDHRDKRSKQATKHAAKKRVARAERIRISGPIRGQSLGAPWAGRLREATRLPEGDGYFIRRPWRAFGTRSTVEAIFHIVGAVRERFPDTHVLAIGDLSAQQGGRISDHSSHQSGRDVDLGLYYYKQPRNYPESFVVASEDTLDCEATYALVEKLAKTKRVHMIFLDFKIQGLLYDWALANNADEDELAKLFQFPHGRGQNVGLVRHEPNHADHLHVRFRCTDTDTACR